MKDGFQKLNNVLTNRKIVTKKRVLNRKCLTVNIGQFLHRCRQNWRQQNSLSLEGCWRDHGWSNDAASYEENGNKKHTIRK